MPHSDSLLLGLRLMREMLGTTPASYVTGILSTAVIIIEAVQASKDVDNDISHLAERVLELSVACSRKPYSQSESQDIQLYAGKFIQSLELIANTIVKLPRRGLMGRIAGKSANARTVRELEEQLEHSSALLSLHLQMSNHKKSSTMAVENNARQLEFQDAIANTQKEQMDLIRTRMVKASEKRVKKKSTFSHHPPPSPHHFYGREEHVQHLADCFQVVPSYQAILGPGGMGKTSLSLRVFHDPRIVAIYRKHRYFLSCESMQDANGLTAGLANIFDLEEKHMVPQLKRVCSIIGSHILFLLDNFETPWERLETREKVETLLCHLTTIPNLSILITLRGGERPVGVPWTRPFLSPILPLSLEASKQLFVSISDTDDSDPCLEQLISAVEGLPLAVTLLASQGQSSSCRDLLSTWEEQKTSMVTRGFDGRLSSLDTSINLSMASSRMRSDASALPSLQILSFLPDGATANDLALMQLDQDHTAFIGRTLRRVSLAYFTDAQRLRVLSPVREYVRARYPPDPELFGRLFDFHRKATRYAAEFENSPQWKTMVEMLESCIGNIHSVIYAALADKLLVFSAIQAGINVASFHRCAFLGSIVSLLTSCLSQARNFKNRNLEGGCYLSLAKIHRDTPESVEYSAAAVSICRELDDKDSMLKALCISADWANTSGQTSLAESKLTEAAGMLSIDSPPDDRIDFLLQTGLWFTRTCKYDEAQKKFDAALLLAKAQCSPWTARKLHSSLCNHYITCDKYSDAVEAALDGLAVPGLQGHWKNTPLLWNLAFAYHCLGRFAEAEEALSTAFEISLQSAREIYMVWSKYYLAFTTIANQRLDEAESHLQGAWVFLQSTSGTLLSLLNLRFVSLLGLLELFWNHTATASAHFDEVKRIGHKIDLQSEMITFYLLPKAYLLIRTGMAKTSTTYSICSILLCRSSEQGADTAASLLLLGDGYILDETPDSITARSCYEVAFEPLRNFGHRRFLAHTLVRLGAVDRLESVSNNAYLERAVTHFKQVAKLYREIGHYPAERFCLDQLHSIQAKEAIDVASLMSLPYPM